jgi:hypothetical protein
VDRATEIDERSPQELVKAVSIERHGTPPDSERVVKDRRRDETAARDHHNYAPIYFRKL